MGIVIASTRALLFYKGLRPLGGRYIAKYRCRCHTLGGGMVARFTFCRVFNARFKSGSRHGEGFVNKHVAGASMQQQTVGYDGMRIRRVHTSIRPQKTRY